MKDREHIDFEIFFSLSSLDELSVKIDHFGLESLALLDPDN